MSAELATVTCGWINVTPSEPCSVCGKPDWCARTVDGTLALCHRAESRWRARSGRGWIHRVNLAPADAPGRVCQARPRGPVAHLDITYRALLAELGLSDSHRTHLLTVRGIRPDRLPLFATIPDLDWADRIDLARRVAARVGSLADVPGFYRRRRGWSLVPTEAGFLVPVVDQEGHILGLQVRADQPAPDEPRYKWLSSAGWGGASSGAPISVWRPELATAGVWTIEGSLKGLITADRLGVCVLAVAGVDNWTGVLDLLTGAPREMPVIVAYDADAERNPVVWRAREDLAATLQAKGYRVQVATWSVGKGIDDAILAGAVIDTGPWRPGVGPPVRPLRTVSIGPPIRSTVTIPLGTPTRPATVPVMAIPARNWR